jgi:hypothetical protein
MRSGRRALPRRYLAPRFCRGARSRVHERLDERLHEQHARSPVTPFSRGPGAVPSSMVLKETFHGERFQADRAGDVVG